MSRNIWCTCVRFIFVWDPKTNSDKQTNITKSENEVNLPSSLYCKGCHSICIALVRHLTHTWILVEEPNSKKSMITVDDSSVKATTGGGGVCEACLHQVQLSGLPQHLEYEGLKLGPLLSKSKAQN